MSQAEAQGFLKRLVGGIKASPKPTGTKLGDFRLGKFVQRDKFNQALKEQNKNSTRALKAPSETETDVKLGHQVAHDEAKRNIEKIRLGKL